MKLRFTISRKIAAGFSVLILSTLIVFALTSNTLSTARDINDKINQVYNPSLFSLAQLKSAVMRSRTLIVLWASVQSREDTKEKLSLVQLVENEIPGIKAEIDSLGVNWTDIERRKKEQMYTDLDDLLSMYDQVQSTLVDMQSYDDPMARFSMSELVEEDGLIYRKSIEVLDGINELTEVQRENITTDSVGMLAAFDRLDTYLTYVAFGLFIIGVLIAIFTARSIVKPVRRLRDILYLLSQGKFPDRAIVNTNDEIGEMSRALQRLVHGLKQTTEYAYNIGESKFDSDFKPLSDEDILGKALISMSTKLKRNEQELEKQVEDRTKEVVQQKNKIEKQNEQRRELLENITASIVYAKHIQDNILPSAAQIRECLPENFIFYVPKAIVSGDFYFVRKYGSKVVVAAVDCTGHGVPGAFMSLVGHNALDRAIALNKTELDPADILTDLNRLSTKALNREVGAGSQLAGRDGMDLALCVYDPGAGTLKYSGAFNPLYHISDGKLNIYKADKIAIGSPDATASKFITHHIELEIGDMIYIFSDGYVDQFGGDKDRKFMYAPFRKMLLEIWNLPPKKQKENLNKTMDAWRRVGGDLKEQVDDMLIIGFRHTAAP